MRTRRLRRQQHLALLAPGLWFASVLQDASPLLSRPRQKQSHRWPEPADELASDERRHGRADALARFEQGASEVILEPHPTKARPTTGLSVIGIGGRGGLTRSCTDWKAA